MPRRLRPDEEALWRHVTKRDTPLHPERTRLTVPEVLRVAPCEPADPPPRIDAFRVGQNVRPAAPPATHASPLKLDRRTQRDLSRGRRTPEAMLDLHGMTLAEAHPALTRFILASFATGRRLVLVITGKGHGRSDPWHDSRGVMRRQVPEWLAGAPLGTVVQEILAAHRSHGGAGAYYVVLRRG